jgi:hypothetical protein
VFACSAGSWPLGRAAVHLLHGLDLLGGETVVAGHRVREQLAEGAVVRRVTDCLQVAAVDPGRVLSPHELVQPVGSSGAKLARVGVALDRPQRSAVVGAEPGFGQAGVAALPAQTDVVGLVHARRAVLKVGGVLSQFADVGPLLVLELADLVVQLADAGLEVAEALLLPGGSDRRRSHGVGRRCPQSALLADQELSVGIRVGQCVALFTSRRKPSRDWRPGA